MRIYTTMESEIGTLFLVAENNLLSAIHMGEQDFFKHEDIDMLTREDRHDLLQDAINQLREYFGGARRSFTLPTKTSGTEFQQKVWEQLQLIPFGSTKSYQDIAEGVGSPRAVRAVGQANKANRLPIIIPCHRVIGKNRTLTGYAGSRTDIKDLLLRLEGAGFKQERL
ncbi:methylated-DNA--[protein]-cysteine S-methyltransferase [Mesobacillus foraminis]|uniref:Methylated-DNA--protein-cysteine methyltransferase n=2 Tax=Mesobacillus foraminis TaxID=279826 RepID=A0A4R2BKG7_9BACI|nr:methylated-DNA--[protein]-cysteine S-methyltransferase [Mesobacillus foraminis]TCN27728.1 methylated-DNA-[protein]-cysteine S-methyltransferase [Mesobacillus foraminis]